MFTKAQILEWMPRMKENIGAKGIMRKVKRRETCER